MPLPPLKLVSSWTAVLPWLLLFSPRHAFVPRRLPRSQYFSSTTSINQALVQQQDRDNSPTEEPLPQKHTVTWQTPKSATESNSSLSFEVYDGETLRTAALRRDIVSPHNGRANLINCRGLGTCGTCAVEIVQGAVDPPERTTKEQLRLNFPPHNFHDNANKLRLACQIQVRGDITVAKRTGFWGQHEDVAVPSVPNRYFGEFEYALDTKSPSAPESAEELPDNDNPKNERGKQ